MNKDTVVASTLGFGLGLIAAILLWIVPRILPKSAPPKTDTAQVVETETDTGAVSGSTSFEIESPRDGDITTAASTTLLGKATMAQFVVVSTSSENHVLTPETDGSFSVSLTLSQGGNDIVAKSYGENHEETKRLSVYYYPEPF